MVGRDAWPAGGAGAGGGAAALAGILVRQVTRTSKSTLKLHWMVKPKPLAEARIPYISQNRRVQFISWLAMCAGRPVLAWQMKYCQLDRNMERSVLQQAAPWTTIPQPGQGYHKRSLQLRQTFPQARRMPVLKLRSLSAVRSAVEPKVRGRPLPCYSLYLSVTQRLHPTLTRLNTALFGLRDQKPSKKSN